MEANTLQKNKLRLELKDVKDKLQSLKTLFEEVKAEREREAEIINEQKERKRRWELDEQRKHRAAELIQQTFKNYKELKKKKKKKRR